MKPNFRALGKRFGAGTKAVAAAVTAADPAALAGALRDAGAATVTVDGAPVVAGGRRRWSSPRRRARAGRSPADGGETVALDLTVTPELRRAGLAREVVRLVQDARKASRAGGHRPDRADGGGYGRRLAEALREHADAVAGEVLATSFAEGPVADGRRDDELGLEFALAKV